MKKFAKQIRTAPVQLGDRAYFNWGSFKVSCLNNREAIEALADRIEKAKTVKPTPRPRKPSLPPLKQVAKRMLEDPHNYEEFCKLHGNLLV